MNKMRVEKPNQSIAENKRLPFLNIPMMHFVPIKKLFSSFEYFCL